MRNVLIALGVFVGLLVALLIWAYTPDIPAAKVDAQYADATSRFLDLPNGVRLHVKGAGPKDAPALVLLHGSDASLHTFDPWIDRLKDRRRVVAIDLPGHGLTGKAPKGDYTRAAMRDAIDAALDMLEIQRFALAGHSMGGGLAWLYALDHADRLDALILIAPVGWRDETAVPQSNDPWLVHLLRTSWGRGLVRYAPVRGLIEGGLKHVVADKTSVTKAMVDRYEALTRRAGNRDATLARAVLREPPHPIERIQEIAVPTLVMQGDADPVVPLKHAQGFAGAIPGARIEILENVGHIPMEEAPDASAQAAAEFLDGSSGES